MIDREKGIKGLAEVSEYMRAKADIAGVGKGKEVFDSWYRAAEDAIALLKEQEPVKPIKSKLSFTHGFDWDIWECGCCRNQLRSFAKYCDRCGHAVDQEEEN